MSEELKPCPFCGSPGEVHQTHKLHFVVRCTNDACQCQIMSKRTPLAAKTVWNERFAQPTPTVAKIADVEQIARDMLSEGGDNTVRLYAYDDQSKFKFNVRLEQGERFVQPFVEAVNQELARRITAALAPLQAELETQQTLVKVRSAHVATVLREKDELQAELEQARAALNEIFTQDAPKAVQGICRRGLGIEGK